jgi:hypothetical protein
MIFLLLGFASACCAAPLRILPVGDSFTAGRNQSYLEPLSALLHRAGIEHEFVGRACELLVPKHPTIAPIVGCSSMRGHQAFWGWTASDVLHGRPGTSLGKLEGKPDAALIDLHHNSLSCTPEWLEDVGPFEVVFVLIGINDAAKGLVGDFKTHYSSIVSILAGLPFKPHIFLGKPLPVLSREFESSSQSVSKLVAEVANEQGIFLLSTVVA